MNEIKPNPQYDEAIQVLSKIRKTLNTPEGADIVKHAEEQMKLLDRTRKELHDTTWKYRMSAANR